jgi:signal transduction histidine kinase
VSQLAKLQPELSEHWARQERMILIEGFAWVVLLIIGGVALVASVLRAKRRGLQIREFFASFSHEIKTSLASLRLQAESLQADKKFAGSPVLDRLVGDTVRLQLQLENSLFFSSEEHLKLFEEDIPLRVLFERIGPQWPGLAIDLKRDCVLRADDRALRTILSNLIQNAIMHGHATKVTIDPGPAADGKVTLNVADDGRGFHKDLNQLGRLFHRPENTSGSGLGLYICRLLARKMNGELKLIPVSQGFQAQLVLPGALR